MNKLSSFKHIINKKYQLYWCIGTIFSLTIFIDLLATLKIGGLDDAYITYTFANNLSLGHGIVWSVGGPPVYGSTTFLYTVILALFGCLGISIPTASVLLGAFFWGLSNAVLFLLIKDKIGLFHAFFTAILSAVSLVAINLSYGMETSLYTFLVLSSFFLYIKNKYVVTSIVSALLIMTRLDGALVPALIIVHFFITNSTSIKNRLIIIIRSILPSIVILIPWVIFIYIYFGSIFPNSFLAKKLFDSSVSGQFHLNNYWNLLLVNNQSFGIILTSIFILISVMWHVKAVLKWKDSANLVFIWVIAYLALYLVERLPDSPWYYVPIIPVIYASFIIGSKWIYGKVLNRVSFSSRYDMPINMLILQIILLIPVIIFAFTAQTSCVQIKNDMFGENIYNNEERRCLSEIILNDMKNRNVSATSVMAFEVGYIGYNIPGEVYDILGLVTPDVVLQGGKKNYTYILEKYMPEYAVIVDAYGYLPTAPIYQSMEFQFNYREIYSLPRSFGHNYKVFFREPEERQKIWDFNTHQSPVTINETNITANNGTVTFDSLGGDPYIIYDNFITPAYDNGLLLIELDSQSSGIFEVFLDCGNGLNYTNSLKFLLLGEGRQTVSARINQDNYIKGLRIDPLNHPGKVILNSISIWD